MIKAIFLILLALINLFSAALCYSQIADLKVEPVLHIEHRRFLFVFHALGVLNVVCSIMNIISFSNVLLAS